MCVKDVLQDGRRTATRYNMVKKMANLKLKYIDIQTLVDIALQCGKDREPIHIYIAADPGSGKTWATKSLEHERGVDYHQASYTPNEYKMHIDSIKNTTKLFIHDDVGRISPAYAKDYISTFCDLTEGHTEFRQFKKSMAASFRFSTIFTSTLGWYYAWRDVMHETGFFDRVLVVLLELSEDTREEYQFTMQESADDHSLSNDPAPRKPKVREKHEPLQLYRNYNIDPRNLRNLLVMSKYLNQIELDELIGVIQSDKVKYSI